MKILLICFFFGFIILYNSSLFAFSGLFPIAYNPRQAGMGGANVGVGGSVMDMESNPGHLGLNADSVFEMGLGGHFVTLEYNDRKIGNKIDQTYSNQLVEKPRAFFPYVGYMAPINDTMSWGLVAYLQGGGGGEFQNIKTNNPSDKSISEILGMDLGLLGENRQSVENIQFRFLNFKVTPGIGFRIGNFSLGLGLDIAYARMNLRREIKDLSGSVTLPGGFDYNSDPTLALGGKLGLVYLIGNNIKIGYSYTARNKFFLNGNIKIDTHDILLNRNIDVSRFMNWPDRHSFGFSWIHGKFLWALDLKYIPWSEGYRNTRFELAESAVTTPLETRSNLIQFNLRWRDSRIISLGMEYEWNENLLIRVGGNYGNTPVSSEGVNPFLGSTTEYHLTTGLGFKSISGEWNFAISYGFPNRVDGSLSSDWTVVKSVNGPGNISIGLFEHSKSSSVISLYMGYKKYFSQNDF